MLVKDGLPALNMEQMLEKLSLKDPRSISFVGRAAHPLSPLSPCLTYLYITLY